MPQPGKARIGHKAPDFKCQGVISGNFHELSLDYYLAKKQWLILMFIPAAFSLICPTEVLAFNNCLDEFTERGCNVAFVSTDSKHCLWHWQHTSRKAGGLGHVSMPLISDQNQRMSRDFGVLQEATGLALRGMFIIDPKGILQQITVNNMAVGRSVLEALRLVEAFKAVSEKGILCPVGWRTEQDNMMDTSFEENDNQLVRDLGEMKLKNLDTNTISSFSLVLPPIKTDVPSIGQGPGSKQSSASAAASASSVKQKSTLAVPPHRNSAASSQRGSTTHAHDSSVHVLDFADLLEHSNASTRASPHEFVSIVEEKVVEDATSNPSGVQRTVDAFKRFSSGWSTPLTSPLSHPRSKESGSTLRDGYFD